MQPIKINVVGTLATITQNVTLTTGLVGQTVAFTFDKAWDGLSRCAVFKAGNSSYTQLNIGEEATIPPELLRIQGRQLSVGVYGFNADGTVVIPTVWTILGAVKHGAHPNDKESATPALPIWAQMEARMEVLEEELVPIDHSMYFDIEYGGLVSLKPEYRGCPTKNTSSPYSVSDNGIGVDGSKINELPEVLIVPDVINNIAVSALVEGMFDCNHRVKSLTIPQCVTALPKKFADTAINLAELKGTENIEVICQAAFQRCAIEKAIFPNLKSFDGVGQFNLAAKMVIADIGNTVTSIPQNCFAFCEVLSCVRGGANVTHIGPKAFFFTRALRSLSFLGQVTFIDWEAFNLSSVVGDGTMDFNWWDFKDSSGCQFGTHPNTGTCHATPAHIYKTQWFTECTLPTKCVVNDLGATFNQANPEFATFSLPNSHDTYGDGCLEISATHIYSALTGDTLISTAEFWKSTGVYPGTNSPRVFVESILAKAKDSDGGSLLAPSGNGNNGPFYTISDMGKWLEALGLQCELLSGGFNKNNLNRIYQDVESGAFALFSYAFINNGAVTGHAVVICGVADNGDLFTLDSNSFKYELKEYTSNVFRVPPWCFPGADILIVKKKEE